MKTTRLLLAASLAFAASFARADTPSSSGPASGYLRWVRYSVDPAGKLRGARQEQDVWFLGAHTRRGLSVSGPGGSWTAYPENGRIYEWPAPPRGVASYPDETRRAFDLVFASRRPIRTERYRGFPCRVYAWHEEQRQIGCMLSGPKDVRYRVYADDRFPAILSCETSDGARMELLEMRLNGPVPAQLFRKPAGLKPIVPLRLPSVPFVLRWRAERVSKRHGWKSEERVTVEGDGTSVRWSHHATNTDDRGRQTTFDPPDKTLTYDRARTELFRELRYPDSGVKQIGQAQMLAMRCDVLEHRSPQTPGERYWVVDHPLLGTISLRHDADDANESRTRVVTKLHFDPPR